LQFVGIVGLTVCLIAALAGLRLTKESVSPWPMIFVLGLGALVLAGIVYTWLAPTQVSKSGPSVLKLSGAMQLCF